MGGKACLESLEGGWKGLVPNASALAILYEGEMDGEVARLVKLVGPGCVETGSALVPEEAYLVPLHPSGFFVRMPDGTPALLSPDGSLRAGHELLSSLPPLPGGAEVREVRPAYWGLIAEDGNGDCYLVAGREVRPLPSCMHGGGDGVVCFDGLCASPSGELASVETGRTWRVEGGWEYVTPAGRGAFIFCAGDYLAVARVESGGLAVEELDAPIEGVQPYCVYQESGLVWDPVRGAWNPPPLREGALASQARGSEGVEVYASPLVTAYVLRGRWLEEWVLWPVPRLG